ncbi:MULTISPECIES: hypothetical protein [unclassified Microcoleus]|uniref:hypothetical protein n=1 Tax=unclassified Microcoleus TaxID=2642155 RepID=UPI002FD1B100
MTDWGSSIQTRALLYPASTICLWVELAPATVRLAEKNCYGRSNKLNISRQHSRDANR